MSQNMTNEGDSSSNSRNDSKFSKTKEKLKNLNGYFSCKNFLYECRTSRKLVLLVVFIALFFDNMLMTIISKNALLFFKNLWLSVVSSYKDICCCNKYADQIYVYLRSFILFHINRCN